MLKTYTPPLSLDLWEEEANHNIKWNIAPASAKRILALISELRMVKFRADSKIFAERLASAEEALKFYAENEWHGSVEIPGGKLIHATLPTGDTARAHFEKFKRKV